MSKVLSISNAITEAMREEMERDSKVFVIGEDVGTMGGAFGLSRGFKDQFGQWRAIDTPISESAFMGMSVGAALRGMRPCVELMYNDFVGVAMDPILNQAAKLRYMTGGQAKVSMVIRAPLGTGRRNAGQHSQNLEAFFTHIPGLKVVYPSTAKDAKGLLKTAIRDDDPVIFLEHKLLYAKKEEIPEEEYLIPLGKADVKREGTDLSIITWGRQCVFSLEAAEELEKEGISVEVLDIRSLVPIDWEAIVATVSKTHNVLVVSEEVKRGSYAGEISAQIMEGLFDELDSPVERVCGLNTVSPFSPPLEDANFPHKEDIIKAVKKILNR